MENKYICKSRRITFILPSTGLDPSFSQKASGSSPHMMLVMSAMFLRSFLLIFSAISLQTRRNVAVGYLTSIGDVSSVDQQW